jgi:hypothetical protein
MDLRTFTRALPSVPLRDSEGDTFWWGLVLVGTCFDGASAVALMLICYMTFLLYKLKILSSCKHLGTPCFRGKSALMLRLFLEGKKKTSWDLVVVRCSPLHRREAFKY